MQSKSDRFPNGLGNDSGELGHNVMDHHFLVGASGKFDGYEDKYYKGRKPNGIYIPRFRNLGGDSDMKNFKRGYGYQGGAGRGNYEELIAEASFGKDYKDAVLGLVREPLSGPEHMFTRLKHTHKMQTQHANTR